MGLFSDDLEYGDLDKLCIKAKRTVGDGVTIELPLYVDARISYVTFPNAKEVIIEGSSVKDLKKSGDLASAFKPIFERYITEAINAHPEYAEEIFPDDFFGEPKVEYRDKRAKELIDSRLFRDALSKIDDPDGFEEVKFEKIYGIAPTGFKIRSVESGLSMPYDYSEEAKDTEIKEGEDVAVPELNVSGVEPTLIYPDDNSIDYNVTETIKEDNRETADSIQQNNEIDRLREETLILEEKCALKQIEIQSAKQQLDNNLRLITTLEDQLKKKEEIVAQYKNCQEQLSKCAQENQIVQNSIHDLDLKRQEKLTQLTNLKNRKVEEKTTLLYSIIKHNRGQL